VYSRAQSSAFVTRKESYRSHPARHIIASHRIYLSSQDWAQADRQS
jgi:hypothetical protein